MSDHETDFYQWTQTQSAAFRAKAWGTPDLENPAEEIESLGQNDRRAIRHQLARVLVHLLKWVYQPHQRGRYRESWRRSIYQARRAIADLIEESSSHQAYAAQQWRRAYWRALQQAAIETGLPPGDRSGAMPLKRGVAPGRGFLTRDITLETVRTCHEPWVERRPG